MTPKKSIDDSSKSDPGLDGFVFRFQPVNNDFSDFSDFSDLQGLQKNPDATGSFVISPSPVLWMTELQNANDHLIPWTIWRELSARSRQRGTPLLKGYDWPGAVLLPSAVVSTLIERGKIKAPNRWNLPVNLLGRFIATLNAWQIDKTIYSFSGLAREIVANSLVSMKLNHQLFGLIPSHCIYIDLDRENSESAVHPSMSGFFACLNADEEGLHELVISEDHISHVTVRRLPLRGQTVDQVASQILARARKTETGQELEDTIWFVDNALHASLSAIMMVCSSHANARHFSDGVSDSDGHGLWTNWRIDRPFTENLYKSHIRALQRDSFHPVVLVAEWVEPADGQLANLRCCLGTRAQWSSMPGISGVLKGVPPAGHKVG